MLKDRVAVVPGTSRTRDAQGARGLVHDYGGNPDGPAEDAATLFVGTLAMDLGTSAPVLEV